MTDYPISYFFIAFCLTKGIIANCFEKKVYILHILYNRLPTLPGW